MGLIKFAGSFRRCVLPFSAFHFAAVVVAVAGVPTVVAGVHAAAVVVVLVQNSFAAWGNRVIGGVKRNAISARISRTCS